MAVYTQLSGSDLEEVAKAFGLGTVKAFDFLPEGSINTNVSLQTVSARWFVRHTTVRSESDLDFEAGLLGLLSMAKVPAVVSVRAQDGRNSIELRGGRACVFRWLAGEEMSRAALTPEHLLELGRVLARCHQVARAFEPQRSNPYSREVVAGWLQLLKTNPQPEVAQAAAELLAAFPAEPTGLLPRGVIHADLFLDNVKWLGNRISALFDFEMACQEALALDLAITLNAWTFHEGAYVWGWARALLDGYRSVRPLEPREAEALFDLCVFGAIRFCASRIRDFHLPDLPAEQLKPKDFRTYLARVTSLKALGSSAFRVRLGLD